MAVKERFVQRAGDDRICTARRKAQKAVLLNLFYQPELAGGITSLDKDESAHALRVLRLRPGDEFLATDGKGSFYACVITNENRGLCHFQVKTTRPVPKPACQIHIAIAPPKNTDRLEWFIEKATEIGVERIIALKCEHSERKAINEERLQKVAVSAMKQSLKAWLPRIQGITPFKDVVKEQIDHKFIAHLQDPPAPHLINKTLRNTRTLTLIGPEGDFTSEEVTTALSNGFQKVSLGQHRLRTETAALVVCHTINLMNEIAS